MDTRITISTQYNLSALSKQYQLNSLITNNTIYKIGDIYQGYIDRLMPSINSAFILLSYNNDQISKGFIYIKDLRYIKKIRLANENIKLHPLYQLVVPRQKILTQVTKEIQLGKGPKLTTNILLTGHYLKLLPLSNILYIAKHIKSESSRNSIKNVGKIMCANGIGVMFRSNSDGVSPKVLMLEFYKLKNQWNFIVKKNLASNSLSLIYKEHNLISQTIRDLYTTKINKIIIDNEKKINELKFFLIYWGSYIVNDKPVKLLAYGKIDDFISETSLSTNCRKLFNNIIYLPYGGYLFIETMNAMTIIDVNSGTFDVGSQSRDTIMKINLAAAKEIVYQIVLRNIAGMILIDFIDMETNSDQKLLIDYIGNLLEYDNNQSRIIQYTKLGILAITRKRAKHIFSIPQKSNNYNHCELSDMNFLQNSCFSYDYSLYSILI